MDIDKKKRYSTYVYEQEKGFCCFPCFGKNKYNAQREEKRQEFKKNDRISVTSLNAKIERRKKSGHDVGFDSGTNHGFSMIVEDYDSKKTDHDKHDLSYDPRGHSSKTDDEHYSSSHWASNSDHSSGDHHDSSHSAHDAGHSGSGDYGGGHNGGGHNGGSD